MVGNQTTTDDTCYWSFGPQADGTVGFYYYTGATHSESSSQTISANSWSHIALTKNSAGIKIWVNGIGTNNIAISGTPQNSASVNLTVGQNSTSLRNIKGYISNLRIVKGTALYSSNFSPSTTPLQPIANTTLLLSGKNSGIYDATLQNDLQQIGDTKVQTAVYKYGTGSMYFDGTGDYLLSHNTNTGNFGTGDFTVEYWFKCGSQSVSYTTQIGTLDANSLAGGSWRFGTHVGNNPGVYFSTHNGSSFTDTIFTTTNYNDNTWHHLAVSRSGTTLRAFVDGTQVGSNQTLSLDLTARRLVIGAELWTPSHYTGYIDDLRITKGYARYTANFTPPSSALKNK
jgi:hypothetical protein